MDWSKFFNWLIPPLLAYFFGLLTIKTKNNSEFKKERRVKNVDIEIEKLSELHKMISLNLRSVEYYVNSYLEYFRKINEGKITPSELEWNTLNKELLNEMNKSYQSEMDRLLILLPKMKKYFENYSKKFNDKEMNYLSMNINLINILPKLYHDTSLKNKKIPEERLLYYMNMLQTYNSLVYKLMKKIENELEKLLINDEKFNFLKKLKKIFEKDKQKENKEKNYFNLITNIVLIMIFILNFSALIFLGGWSILRDQSLNNTSLSKLLQNETFTTLSLFITILSFITAGFLPSIYSLMTSERDISNKRKPLTNEQRLLKEDTKDLCQMVSYTVLTLLLVMFILSSTYTNIVIVSAFVIGIFLIAVILIASLIKLTRMILKKLRA